MTSPSHPQIHLAHVDAITHFILQMTDPAAPSTVSIAIATAILSLAAGYFLGTASSLGLFSSSSSSSPKTSQAKKSWPNSYDVKIHPDSSDEEVMKSLGRKPKKSREIKDSEDEGSSSSEDDDEEAAVGDLSTFEGNREECKMVLVVRTDLGMGKGILVSPASHPTHMFADPLAFRESRCPSLPCNISLLYLFSLLTHPSSGSPPLATAGAGEDRCTSLLGRRVDGIAGTSVEFGPLC